MQEKNRLGILLAHLIREVTKVKADTSHVERKLRFHEVCLMVLGAMQVIDIILHVF